tara:strand:- start:911 stop:1663 length:753 start_codon:yes stop_codon:yes gene_type:complete
MNIKEIEPERPIKISKFDFSCDDIDANIPKPLPQSLNFFKLICGRPGSGKTTLIINLLCKKGKCFNNKFDRVYIFSPSLTTIKNNPFTSIPENQIKMELTIDDLEGILSEIKGTGDKVLLIIDDCVNDITKSSELQRVLSKILMNRRHLAGEGGSVSVMMTTQVYNKIPAPIRKTASHIYIYHTRNKKELDTIFDELILIPKKQFYEILNYVFDKRNNFLYLDINKSVEKMFHKNFNQLCFKIEDPLEIV